MSNGKYVAYYRVSTQKQGSSGLGLEAQQKAVRDYLNGGKWQLIAELTEVESGKRSDREQLNEALRLCRIHKAKLVIANLSRLSRNVAFVSALMEAKIAFVAVDFPTANDLTVHILSAVAQHETSAVSSRTKAALAAAKARGVKLGTPSSNTFNVTDRRNGNIQSALVRKSKAHAYASDVLPLALPLKKSGLSLRKIAEQMTKQGIPTPKGNNNWTATGVKRLFSKANSIVSN